MSSRTKVLVVLCELLLVLAGVVAWYLLSDREAPGVAHAPSTSPSEVESEEPAAALMTPQAQAPADATETVEESARTSVATKAEAELDGAVWISGRVVFPAGTPLDEKVEIVGKSTSRKSHSAKRVPVEAHGNFRLALPKGTRTGNVELDARHLYLPNVVGFKVQDGKLDRELVLEPLLGGCIEGELRLPPGAQDLAKRQVGRAVNAWGASDSVRQSVNRVAVVDADLRFELRGLDPNLRHMIAFDPQGLAELELYDERIAAGATRRLDLDLILGVRLRGRVISPGASPPREITLHCLSQTAEEAAGKLPDFDAVGFPSGTSAYLRVETDGTFDIRGVKPGHLTLLAFAKQRTEAQLHVGPVADGETREGLELALGLGGEISGAVRFTGGTPAVGARIELAAADRSDSKQTFYMAGMRENDIGEVLTAEDGSFRIRGLVGGPFHVTATAKSVERQPKQTAKLENVALGTTGLELELQGGFTLTGIVVDDTGAPVERYTLVARPEAASPSDESKALTARVRSKDGRFELAGVPAGAHELTVAALKHVPPEPRSIKVPPEIGPFTLVVQREASLSGIVLLPDGAPASRASVYVMDQQVRDEDRLGDRTDSQGAFQVKSVGVGTVRVRAKLDGYAASATWTGELSPAQAVEGVQLVLRRSARITGEVQPAHQDDFVAGRRLMGHDVEGASSISATTDERGRFEIENVAPGEYQILLLPSPEEHKRLKEDAEPEEQNWLTEDMMRKVSVHVEEGGAPHVVFGPPEPANVRIRGVVRRGGSPQASVRVRAVPAASAAGESATEARTDAAGRFELGVVRAGKFRVEALPAGARGLGVGAEHDVPASGLDGVEIELPSGRIAGVAHVESLRPNGWIQVVLERSESERAGISGEPSDWPDAKFEFTSLPAGKYTLVASGWIPDNRGRPSKGFGPVKQEIELAEGQQLEDVRIELGQR